MIQIIRKLDPCPAVELPEKLGLSDGGPSTPEPKPFDSVETALAYCEANLPEGDTGLMALLVWEPKIAPETLKKVEKLRARAVELSEKIRTLAMVDPATGKDTWQEVIRREIIEKTKQQKSKTKKCVKCESIIAVAYIEAFECPVCRTDEFLMTTTSQDAMRSRGERIDAARKECQEAVEKAAEMEREALTDSAELKKTWVVFQRTQEGVAPDAAPVAADEAGHEETLEGAAVE